MASKLLIVIDTGYLLELFKVPKHFNEHNHNEIKKRFEIAIEKKASLFLPLPCLYELANHIANVNNGAKRKELADKLYRQIFNATFSLTITPANSIEKLPEFLKNFKDNYVIQNIGLVDAFVIHEARRLKAKKSTNQVHIWTTDKEVKAYEPDNEENPFLTMS
jgi:predicted nucleic acid-binding protein